MLRPFLKVRQRKGLKMIDSDFLAFLLVCGFQELLEFCRRWDISTKELREALKDKDWWQRQNNLPTLSVIELCYLLDEQYKSVEEIATSIAKLYFPFPDKNTIFRIFLFVLLRTITAMLCAAERRRK